MKKRNHNCSNLFVILLITMALTTVFYTGQAEAGEEANQAAATTVKAADSKEWQVMAATPGVKILQETIAKPGVVIKDIVDPNDTASDWLFSKNLEEGRNLLGDDLYYVSIGSAMINARPNDPDYIDSRFLAFQRAILEAKAKTAIFLGVDLSTSSGTSETEISPRERAKLEEIVNDSKELKQSMQEQGVTETVLKLFKQSGQYAKEKLQQASEKLGNMLNDGEKKTAIQAKQRQQIRKNNLRNISEASIKTAACAMKVIQGTQVVQTYEASYKEGYKVVVVTLWSKNMQHLVDIMESGTSQGGVVPMNNPRQAVTQQLPTTAGELACLIGIRSFINQHGEYTLLAFGQADIDVLTREDKATERGLKKARLRALAAMRSFMGEKIVFAGTDELHEVLAEYASNAASDNASEKYHAVKNFEEKIKAVAKEQRIKGIQGLISKEIIHPFTDKPIAFKVMSWSPGAQAMANEMGSSMMIKKKTLLPVLNKEPENVPQEAVESAAKKAPATARKGLINSGKGAQRNAW